MTNERLKQLMEQVGMPNSISLYCALQQAENEGFQAGAASRDAEIAELVAALNDVRAMIGHPDNIAIIDAALAKVRKL